MKKPTRRQEIQAAVALMEDEQQSILEEMYAYEAGIFGYDDMLGIPNRDKIQHEMQHKF